MRRHLYVKTAMLSDCMPLRLSVNKGAGWCDVGRIGKGQSVSVYGTGSGKPEAYVVRCYGEHSRIFRASEFPRKEDTDIAEISADKLRLVAELRGGQNRKIRITADNIKAVLRLEQE